jgi:hypothetical protein
LAFDFPSSPSNGQQFTPAGGPTYIWNAAGSVWKLQSIITTPAYSNRNRICNPAMQHSQENGNAAGTTLNYYAADQWMLDFIHSSGVMSLARLPTSSGNLFPYLLRMTCTTAKGALAAGDYGNIQQRIEGIRISDFAWGSANALPAVLRVLIAAPAGTWAFNLKNNPVTHTLILPFTVTAGEVGTYVWRTFAIPGPTVGTWNKDNTLGMYLGLTYAAGTTYQTATTNAWVAGNFLGSTSISNGLASTSNGFDLANVGLYLDASGSGVAPAWEMPDEASELIACQRYFRQWGGVSGDSPAVGQANTATASHVLLQWSGDMRTSPTFGVSAFADWGVTAAAGTAVVASNITVAANGANNKVLAVTVASGLVAGNSTRLNAQSTNGRLTLNSRM